MYYTACPKCQENGRDGSGDNLKMYGDGLGGYCHACGFTIPSDSFKSENKGKLGEEMTASRKTVSIEKVSKEVVERIKNEARFAAVPDRGIKEETSRYYKIRYSFCPETGQIDKQYTPLFVTLSNGESLHCGYKIRKNPKSFYLEGYNGKEVELLGQYLFRTFKRQLLIVGGEYKMLAAYQMLSDYSNSKGYKDSEKVAVVSLPNGEADKYALQKNYKFIDQFDKVILCLDNDEAGNEATKELVNALPYGKAYVMKMRYKDADEYTKNKKEHEFVTDFYNAKKHVSTAIVSGDQMWESMLEFLGGEKIPFPPIFKMLSKKACGGLFLGDIMTIGAASGIGKTTFVEEFIHFWLKNLKFNIGVLSLECSDGPYLAKILQKELKVKFLDWDWNDNYEERMALVNSPEGVKAYRDLCFDSEGEPKLFLLERTETSNLESIKKYCEELVRSCNCKIIVIDPIQDLIDAMSDQDGMKLIAWQKDFTQQNKCAIINISHIRKNATTSGKEKANSEGREPTEEDFSGSSTIFKSSSLNLLLWRNKNAISETERNTTKSKLTKNRHHSDTGYTDDIFYDKVRHQLVNFEDYLQGENNESA